MPIEYSRIVDTREWCMTECELSMKESELTCSKKYYEVKCGNNVNCHQPKHNC